MISLVQAIANFEGYNASPTNLPTANNNPGDIIYGNFAANYGATPDPNSAFAVFPSATAGFTALNDLLSGSSYSNLSLQDAITKWNGGGANSGAYVNYVAGQTGASPTDLVGDILNGSNSYISGSDNLSVNSGDGDYSDNSGINWGVVALITGVGFLIWLEL